MCLSLHVFDILAPTKKRPERRSSKEFCRDIKKPRRVGEVLHREKSAPFRGECQYSPTSSLEEIGSLCIALVLLFIRTNTPG